MNNDNRNPFQDQGYDDINPFGDQSSPTTPQVTNNPFIEDSVEFKKKKKKFSLFKKKKKVSKVENDDVLPVTTLTLKEVQNMDFSEEEKEKPLDGNVVIQDVISKSNSLERRMKLKTTTRFVRHIIEILVVTVAIYLFTTRYMSYSKNVTQVLKYQSGSSIFELTRSTNGFSVVHKEEESCDGVDCPSHVVSEYPIQFGKIEMAVITLYYDITFRLENGYKTIYEKDLRTSLATASVYSMIHNDSRFIGFHNYDGYKLAGFEQKSEYFIRGFNYEERYGHFYLVISLGEKDSSGYDMKMVKVFNDNKNFVFYFSEIEPLKTDQWTNITHPALSLELDEKPNSIKVVNISTGEEFYSY